MRWAAPMEQAAEADGFDIVHARVLRFLPELVAQLGGDAAGLLRGVGIDPAAAADGAARATYRQMVDLLEHAAMALGCPDFGMRLAKLQSGSGMFGPLGSVMRNARTFGDALAYARANTYAHSRAARIWSEREADSALFVGHDILLDGMPGRGQAIEQILLDGHLAAMEITGGRARVRRVHFRHQPLSPGKTYRRYFGCEVRFGEDADGVVFAAHDLAAPIVAQDDSAYQIATAYIDAHLAKARPPFHAEVRGLVMRFLGADGCTNGRIAALLNLHPRTMRRRLIAEGTSFQRIKDEVRRDVMRYYLARTDLDFTAISERLGFAEQSVMTRCCNLWFGLSPTRLRATLRRA